MISHVSFEKNPHSTLFISLHSTYYKEGPLDNYRSFAGVTRPAQSGINTRPFTIPFETSEHLYFWKTLFKIRHVCCLYMMTGALWEKQAQTGPECDCCVWHIIFTSSHCLYISCEACLTSSNGLCSSRRFGANTYKDISWIREEPVYLIHNVK